MLNVKIKYETKLDELIARYKNFLFLYSINFIKNGYTWRRGFASSHDIQVIFTGKTGYGKSSTINAIAGKKVLEVDDIESCTKYLQSVEYDIGNKRYYFSLGDLPGLGESLERDKEYIKQYEKFIDYAHVIVHVIRADQRDYSIDIQFYEKFLNKPNVKEKVIIGLNFVDKVEPINRNSPFNLNSKQKENLNQKIEIVSNLFNVKKEDIIPYSAKENYNIGFLMDNIAEKIKKIIKS